MHPFYVVEQNAKLRIRNRRLQVEKSGEVLARVPLGHVSQVVVYGNVGLTTPAIKDLLNREIEVAFLTRRGEYRGRLVGQVTPHVPLRRAQYKRLDQPEFCLGMAKAFVEAKLRHQRALLMRHNRERGDPTIAESAEQIRRALDDLPRKTAVSSVLGIEGSATAAYFRGFRLLFGPEWRFEKRVRRPPTDPVNVLLSFGYTLITQAAMGAVQTAGLDPFAGFLHEYVYNRPGLALDLVEEFRAVVDGVALWCCNSGQLTPGDFKAGPAERPVVLQEEGLRRFLGAYEERMSQSFTHPIRGLRLPMRQCMLEQARQIAQRIKDDRPGYQGMGFR